MEQIKEKMRLKTQELVTINSQMASLNFTRNQLEKDLRELKSEMKPYCEHKNKSEEYWQRITPSREQAAQVCLECGTVIYLDKQWSHRSSTGGRYD